MYEPVQHISMPPLLRVTETREPDGIILITLTGELDLSTIGALNFALERVAGAERVGLDIAEVTFADATGIGCVLEWKRQSRREGWQLEIDRRVCRQVRRLVDLFGVDDVLWG